MYDVFISYKSENCLEAVELQQVLEEHGLRVFRDEDGLTLARNVRDELPLHLRQAATVVVLWSELAGKSEWVTAEAVYAWGAGKYIPLILPNTKGSNIPSQIRDYTAKQYTSVRSNIGILLEEIEHIRRGRVVPIRNRMPATDCERLIGRDGELSELDRAWSSGKTRVFLIDAVGGTGKTALISHFLDRMANRSWCGAERVYCWSFYSQGTDEKRRGDADGFFAEALAWFGYRGPPIKSAMLRGEKLAELINEKKTLLVLDGLEPLQYPARSHGLEGKLKDDGIAALLKRLILQMNGMTIITTRIGIPELAGRPAPSVSKISLNQLALRDGIILLRTLGVRASLQALTSSEQEAELSTAVELLKGHPFSLTLLATFSKLATSSIVPTSNEIRRALVDERVSQASYAMMRRYEILFEEQLADDERGIRSEASGDAARQLAVLYLIGLFDRPAEGEAIEALLARPIEGLAEELRDATALSWKLAIDRLRKLKLLLPEVIPGEIDAHPLVREYFGSQLKRSNPEAYREANRRLYEHYKLREIPHYFRNPVRYGFLAFAARQKRAPGWRDALCAGRYPNYMVPPTLRGIPGDELKRMLAEIGPEDFNAALSRAMPNTIKDMEPLFASVSHGCAAGMYNAAFYEVYFARIMRGDEWFATGQLGAFGADLSVLTNFFTEPFKLPAPGLHPADESVIIGNAAFRLRALGRLSEALAPQHEALRRSVAAENWHHSSVHAGNLSQLRQATGHIKGAIAAARDAVEYADRMPDHHHKAMFQRISKRAILGDALHQSGALEEAGATFYEAEILQAKTHRDRPLLFAHSGALYCDYLLSCGRQAEVKVRAEKALTWGHALEYGVLTSAFDNLSIGRATLALKDLQSASQHADCAIEEFHASGSSDDIPLGYVARASLHRQLGRASLAEADLDEAQDIADRCDMKLLQIDIALERARLALPASASEAVVDGAERATIHIESVDKLVSETGYCRREPDVNLLRARSAISVGDFAGARRCLNTVSPWITQGWHCHAAEFNELGAAVEGKA